MTDTFDTGTLSPEDFEPLVGQSLTFSDETNELPMTLVECEKLPHFQAEGFRMPFTLIFESPDKTTLAQGNYLVELPGKGKPKLFVVPIGQGKCQIVFN